MMLNLLDLPNEIIIIIIKQLDIKTVYNLYKSCRTLKNIILMQGVIRRCNLSCNTLSTAKSLQLSMIKHVSKHLHVLDLCGVSNLRKTSLLPAIRRMKSLKTLDVSCTGITMFDMLDIYKNCLTIENITIDFPARLQLPDKMLLEFQEVFKNFINVHFVMSKGLSNIPLRILKKSSLNTLTYTLCDSGKIVSAGECGYGVIDVICQFKHLCIIAASPEKTIVYEEFWKEVLPQVKLDNLELIIIRYDSTFSISTSPIFFNFFSENFKLTSLCIYDANKIMRDVAAIFIWNKNTSNFDKLFYLNLKKRIKEILTCDLNVGGEHRTTADTQSYNRFVICPTLTDSVGSGKVNSDLYFKRRRIVENVQVFDYDKIFQEHDNVKLRIYNSYPINVTLTSSNEYLRKLTYLSLEGPMLRYSNEFFNILFRCCKQLITLNIETPFSCSSIMRCIPLSQSLKNIRLIDKRIDFKTLFSSFTQCKTLENISVIDSSVEYNELAKFITLYQLENLYSVHIQAMIKKSTLINIRKETKSFLEKYPEHYINFILDCPSLGGSTSDYNPYFHVFNLSSIKPI